MLASKVRANGLTFHVDRFRTGPPGDRPIVVCVHGLAVVDKAASAFVLGFHLARDAEVIAYDLRGHGRTDQPASGYKIADHAEDLVALLDAMGITQPIHLVGFSYGGAIATLAAMRHPERLASLTLLDGHVPMPGWEETLFYNVKCFVEWEEEARAHGLTERDDQERAIVQHVIKAFQTTPRRAANVTRRVRVLFETTTLREDLNTEAAYDKEDFARIDCPVLGIYGDQSDLYWVTDRLPALIRDVTIHTVPGADHLGVFWALDHVRPLVRKMVGLPSA